MKTLNSTYIVCRRYFKLFFSKNVFTRLHISGSILSYSNHVKLFSSNGNKKVASLYDENVEMDKYYISN